MDNTREESWKNEYAFDGKNQHMHVHYFIIQLQLASDQIQTILETESNYYSVQSVCLKETLLFLRSYPTRKLI
ncbi:unnamed protein product, partial [Vitis vinifera]|uniref:Uncharacterized protein n=1 Tax=Vitis vinifera TaxID=29760 RepID=D7TFF9_VITVI